MVIIEALFLFFTAFIFAAMEIEIEGKFGWAEKIPTWYRRKGIAGRVYGILMNNKPLTGYHLIVFFMPLLLFHSGFFLGMNWTLKSEMAVLAVYFLWAPFWDFLWFVLNPEYGIKNFKKEKVWWYAKSKWVADLFPVDYISPVVISFVIAYLTSYLTGDFSIVMNNLGLFLLLLLFTFLTMVFIARPYMRWHRNMRKRDDRKISGIFHNIKKTMGHRTINGAVCKAPCF